MSENPHDLEQPTPPDEGGHHEEGPHGGNGEAAAEEHVGLHVDRYEAGWIRVSLIIVAVFILAIVVAATAYGIQVPGAAGRVNPNTLNDPGSPWAQPGLRELAPGKYEVYMVAQTWSFVPDKIEVPVGSEVTFYLTARDVIHGFKLAGTNVNLMAIPGQISTLSAKFSKPGVYNYICHEYCGYGADVVGHQTMYGTLTVLPSHALTETAQLSD